MTSRSKKASERLARVKVTRQPMKNALTKGVFHLWEIRAVPEGGSVLFKKHC